MSGWTGKDTQVLPAPPSSSSQTLQRFVLSSFPSHPQPGRAKGRHPCPEPFPFLGNRCFSSLSPPWKCLLPFFKGLLHPRRSLKPLLAKPSPCTAMPPPEPAPKTQPNPRGMKEKAAEIKHQTPLLSHTAAPRALRTPCLRRCHRPPRSPGLAHSSPTWPAGCPRSLAGTFSPNPAPPCPPPALGTASSPPWVSLTPLETAGRVGRKADSKGLNSAKLAVACDIKPRG